MKLFLIVLSVLFLLNLNHVKAAESDFVIENYGDEFKLIEYNGKDTTVKIPEHVTHISENAFSWRNSVKKVIIPNSVRYIEKKAFLAAKSLTEIIIPKSVESIGDRAFAHCTSLEKIVIPDTVRMIGDELFAYCSKLKHVTINAIIYEIPEGMFRDCEKLQTIIFPNTVKSVKNEAFFHCTSLSSIKLNNIDEIGERAFEGCALLKDIQIPVISKIEARAFYECSKIINISIGKNAKLIGEDAFTGTPWMINQKKKNPLVIINGVLIDGTNCVGKVSIPKEVETINRYAFYKNNNITSVILNKDTIKISDLAFAYCTNLQRIYLPASVKEIGDNVFYGCEKLKAIYGQESSFLNNYTKSNNISFKKVDSSASMPKPSLPQVRKEELREDYHLEVGSVGYFQYNTSLASSYSHLLFESLNPSIVSVTNEGYYQAKAQGTTVILLKGEQKGKAQIIKVLQINVFTKNTEVTAKKTNTRDLLILDNGHVVVADRIYDRYDDKIDLVRVECYGTDKKIKWTYTIKSQPENSNSNISYETFYGVFYVDMIVLKDGNILVGGYARGRVTGATTSRYNIVNAGWLCKLDIDTGKIIWEKLFETNQSCQFMDKIQELANGNLMFMEDVFAGGDRIVVTDRTGNIITDGKAMLFDEKGSGVSNLIAYQGNDTFLALSNIDQSKGAFYLYQINVNGDAEIIKTIPLSHLYFDNAINYPVLLKGNHNDYYVYASDQSSTLLYHLDSKFNVINKEMIEIYNISDAILLAEDKIVITGTRGDTGTIVIYDCITEKVTSGTFYNIEQVLDIHVDKDVITAVGNGYRNNNIYTYKIKNLLGVSNQKDVDGLTFNKVKDQVYTGKPIKPGITIYDGKKKLTSGKDYTVTYLNNKKTGVATIIVLGKNNYNGAKVINFKINAKKK